MVILAKGIDLIHLQVRFSNDLAVFLVVLVQNSGEICATLPTGEEAKRRKLRLDLRRLQCGGEPANQFGYLRCWRLRGSGHPDVERHPQFMRNRKQRRPVVAVQRRDSPNYGATLTQFWQLFATFVAITPPL